MKTISLIPILCLGILLNLSIKAQSHRSVIFKVDAMEALKKQMAVGVEWRISPKGGVELQLGYLNHDQLPIEFFDGEWTTEYMERRSYVITAPSNALTEDTDWQYLGNGRPLPETPPAINPISTFYTRLGYAISFQNKPNGLRLILLPGISLLRSRYFEVKDKTIRGDVVTKSWQLGPTPNEKQLVEQTIAYNQKREMRGQNRWVGGGTYAFGLAWQAKFGLSFEARVTVGANFGEGINIAEKPSPIMDNFYGQGTIFVGWAF